MDKEIAVSPHGNYFIIYNYYPFGNYLPSLWNSKTRKQIGEFDTHENYFSAVAFSPDQEYLATGNQEGEVKQWSVKDQKEIRLITKLPNMTRNIVFSTILPQIYVTSEDKFIRVFSIDSNKEIDQLKGQDDEIWGLSISKSGKYLLSGGDDNIAVLWEISA
jgi:WD40 repeat protein